MLRWTEGSVEVPAGSPGGDTDAVLLLPGKLALVRPLQLPATAVSRLRDIVQFEIERLTPFSPDQVYFDAVLTRPLERGQATLSASLIVVPRQTLDAAVEAAATYAARLVAVDVEGGDGTPLGANLLPVSRRYRPPERWRRWSIALALICVIAGFGFLMGLLQARQRGIEQLDQQAATLLAQAAQIQRREYALAQMHRFSLGSSWPEPPPVLGVLSALSAALPPDSHLLHIELKDGLVTARGQTADLSAVLTGLGNSSIWKTPELTGSRTLPDGKTQEFSLRLTTHGRPAVHTP